MRIFFTRIILILIVLTGSFAAAQCQNSVLVNFGDTSCGGQANASFSLIKNPLSAGATVLSTCDLGAQLPNPYYTFVAYNPLNKKIYIADTRTGQTRIWALNISLPSDITCPTIPVTPDYAYAYVSNNFEFDNQGNLWSLSNYNTTAGQAHIDKFDVATGNILSTSILQFPAGSEPSTIYSGDLTILPNGRMFAVLGFGPSRLYEITGYASGGTATATYLQSTPRYTFGLAYLNGGLEVAGFDTSGCYSFQYTIANNTLSPQMLFQNGQSPFDNSSISPTIGAAKQLTNAVLVNSNTADLTYEIYVRNLGNVSLNNVQLTDDLGAAFGANNVSNVSAAFVPGANAGGLTINAGYNGTTDINIINPGQQLNNLTTSNQDYFFKVQVQCRVTNLDPNIVYFNSAVAQSSIGNAANNTLINVADSSNNGDASATDPNNDSNASGPGENVPTPFNFGVLPVHFINIAAVLVNKTDGDIRWSVATPTAGAAFFEPEYSTDGTHWQRLARMPITDPNRSEYNFIHQNIPAGIVYYRIKQIDNNGLYIFSRIVSLHTGDVPGAAVYPNPADHFINIILPAGTVNAFAEMYDAIGRRIFIKEISSSNTQIDCRAIPGAVYFLKINDGKNLFTKKILVRH